MRKMILLVMVIVLMVSGTSLVKADLVFDNGHNIFDDSYPYYDEVWVIDDAVLDILGGAMGKLELTNFATANIYGGDMDKLFIKDSSTVNIYDGTLDMFAGGNDSLGYLYAYDVTYHATGGVKNDGWIEGTYYSNDTPFSFSFYNDTSYSHLSIVPEPAAVILFGLGGLLLRKRN